MPGSDPAVDFNDDGYADLAVDGPTSGKRSYVAAVLGGPDGLSAERKVVRTRKGLGIPEPEGADQTSQPALQPEGQGQAFAPSPLTTGPTADFDGDGFTDMIVWGEHGYMVRGGPDGLAKKATRLPWEEDGAEEDGMGPTVAAGDFDGDGAVDLVHLDLHLEDHPDRYEAAFLRGPFDRSAQPSAVEELPLPVTPEDTGHSDEVEAFDADGDKAADLMIRRNYDESPAPHVVLASGAQGPAAERLEDTPEGHETSSGDFDGDGRPDLLVSAHGVPNNENQMGADDPELHPGYVDFYPGSQGFAAGEPTRITRSTPGVPGKAKDADGFGRTVLVADVQGDGYDDALVDPGAADTAGERWRVTLLRGSPEGVTEGTAVRLTPPARGRDAALAWMPAQTGDFDGDGFADLLMAEWNAGAEQAYSRFAAYRGTEDGFAAKPQRFSTKGW